MTDNETEGDTMSRPNNLRCVIGIGWKTSYQWSVVVSAGCRRISRMSSYRPDVVVSANVVVLVERRIVALEE